MSLAARARGGNSLYGIFYVALAGFTVIMSYDVHEMLAHVRLR